MEVKSMVRASVFVAVIAVFAQLAIPIGPVPVTLSILGVFLCGWALPPIWAFLSCLVYLLLGAAGVPVFAGFKAGVGGLLGPTGGFLMIYPIMAVVVSLSYRRIKGIFGICVGLLMSGVICHAAGVLWLAYSNEIGFDAAFNVASKPFILIDLGKMLVAGFIMWRVKWSGKMLGGE